MPAPASGNTRPQKSALVFVCGTPRAHCTGFKEDGGCFHGTCQQVRSCERRYYLTVMKYTQVGPREFDTGTTILVLAKHPTRGKPGKAGRFMARGIITV